ncbi:MAG: hypothetical protein ACSLE2_11830 [Lysobacterales bacterium]
MNALRLSPVVLSFLLLAAHFYRAGQLALTTACLAAPLLLFLRQRWVPRLFQTLLALGALEWLRSLYVIASMRIAFDQPWARLAAILGVVALFTAGSALVFRNRTLRRRYQGQPSAD